MKRTPFGSPTLSDQALMPFPSLKMGPGKSARSHTADEFIFVKEIRGGDRDVSGAAGRSKNLNYHYLFSHGSGFSFPSLSSIGSVAPYDHCRPHPRRFVRESVWWQHHRPASPRPMTSCNRLIYNSRDGQGY